MKLSLILLIFLSFFQGNNTFAWSEMGHKLVGGIAEEVMSQDAKEMVRGIIGIEPLMVSALFPDQVRDDQRFTSNYDYSPFHFCEIPVGSTYQNRPTKVSKDCFSAMKYSQDLIKNPKNQREIKMIALRYLIHVVGDIHQPLHVGNGYDRGGNACKIQWQGKTMNFHSFWDTNIVDLMRLSYQQQLNMTRAPLYAGDVLKAMKSKRPEMFTATSKAKYGSGSLEDWLNESQVLRETIYPDKPSDMAHVPKGEEYRHRPYCQYYLDQNKDQTPAEGSVIVESKIPDLSSSYVNSNKQLAEDQILKAGLRLASVLDQLAAEMKSQNINRIDDSTQSKILKFVQDFLTNP